MAQANEAREGRWEPILKPSVFLLWKDSWRSGSHNVAMASLELPYIDQAGLQPTTASASQMLGLTVYASISSLSSFLLPTHSSPSSSFPVRATLWYHLWGQCLHADLQSRRSSEVRLYTQSLMDFDAEFQQLPEVEQVSCRMSDLAPPNRLIASVESNSSFQARTLNASLIHLFFPNCILKVILSI